MDTCLERPRRKSCVMVTPPTGLVVPVADTREYLKAYTEEDALIERLIRRATEFCQGWQGRQYLVAQFAERYDCFPAGNGEIELLWSPGYRGANEDTTIAYTDTNGTIQTLRLSGGDFGYNFESVRPILRPNYGETWPPTLAYPDAVRVSSWAGVAFASQVGEREKQAIDMLTAHWYRNREAVLTGTISKEVEFSVANLLGPKRIPAVA